MGEHFMGRNPIFSIMALASAALAFSPLAAPLALPGGLDKIDRVQRRGKGQNNRRGKGKRSPPKSRPNRLTMSKRVRRKHRRAHA